MELKYNKIEAKIPPQKLSGYHVKFRSCLDSNPRKLFWI